MILKFLSSSLFFLFFALFLGGWSLSVLLALCFVFQFEPFCCIFCVAVAKVVCTLIQVFKRVCFKHLRMEFGENTDLCHAFRRSTQEKS